MILLALLNEASTFINRDEDNIIASSSIYQQKKPSENFEAPSIEFYGARMKKIKGSMEEVFRRVFSAKILITM